MNPARVLVVDDNPVNLEMASFLLQADGWQVRTAPDAETALLQLAEFQPQLLLLDIQLPRIDGLTLTRRLRADPAHAGLVVVAFTAYAMKGDEQRMRDAGCDGYIAKPIDVQGFAAQLRSYLAKAA